MAQETTVPIPAGESAAGIDLATQSPDSPIGTQRSPYVKQVGSHRQCAKSGCTVRPSWRVILGHHVIQAYVCQSLFMIMSFQMQPRGLGMPAILAAVLAGPLGNS
jgi:hypothetical protein